MENQKNSTHLVLTKEELAKLNEEGKLKFDIGPVDTLDISGGLYIQVGAPVEDKKDTD